MGWPPGGIVKWIGGLAEAFRSKSFFKQSGPGFAGARKLALEGRRRPDRIGLPLRTEAGRFGDGISGLAGAGRPRGCASSPALATSSSSGNPTLPAAEIPPRSVLFFSGRSCGSHPNPGCSVQCPASGVKPQRRGFSLGRGVGLG